MRDDPQFDRLIADIERARKFYESGDLEKYRAIMQLVGSIAFANSKEFNPRAPRPESASGSL